MVAVASSEFCVSTAEVRVGGWFAAVQLVKMMNINTDNGNKQLALFIQTSISWGEASEASYPPNLYTTKRIVEFKI